VQAAHDKGMSVRECARKFGFHTGSWYKAVERGAIRPRSHVIPIEELLVQGRRTGRDHLKARLIKVGLKENRCERCGISSWRGKPLNAHLHHKDGDGTDNRIDNLEFLCPNCHSQTDTYGGRNGHRRPERHLKLVEPLPDGDAAPEADTDVA
jgi:5-methylcytosine-specific restriction endonuclease McrA